MSECLKRPIFITIVLRERGRRGSVWTSDIIRITIWCAYNTYLGEEHSNLPWANLVETLISMNNLRHSKTDIMGSLLGDQSECVWDEEREREMSTLSTLFCLVYCLSLILQYTQPHVVVSNLKCLRCAQTHTHTLLHVAGLLWTIG